MGASRDRSRALVTTWPSRQVHVEWGRAALEHAAARGDGLVIVDVLSFSTLVALVTARGAAVRALAPHDISTLGGRARVAVRFDAHVAGETRADPTARVTLSPASAARVEPGDRLVVPSLNGGLLTARAASAPFAIVACLRNASAVGRFVAAALRLGMIGRVTIVAAGEQWKEDHIAPEGARFAVEDWLGAGAVASGCRSEDATLSSEAETAARGYAASRRDVHAVLADCVSGRELIGGGFETDVALAAAPDVDDGVPWLRSDGFIERLPFALRPARGSDRPFLFDVRQSTMREYVIAAVGRWDEATQRRHFGSDLARTAVVSVDGRDGGMVETRVEADGFYLANVQLSPPLQGRGVGRSIVELLIAVAHRRGLPLRLRVLKVNVRAQQFYERLGMQVTGELPRHWTMALPPGPGSTVAGPP
jgi:2-phosphosulfolactate phosphatase